MQNLRDLILHLTFNIITKNNDNQTSSTTIRKSYIAKLYNYHWLNL